jgi:hypothetical protein
MRIFFILRLTRYGGKKNGQAHEQIEKAAGAALNKKHQLPLVLVCREKT